MANRPARFTQVDVRRAIRAARAEGADEIEVRSDGAIVVRLKRSESGLSTGETPPVEPEREIVL